MTTQELSERIESLQNLMIAVATGGTGDAREYGILRQEIVDHSLLKDIAPRFLRTCRTTAQFWQFIKYEYRSYTERREFIWDSFRPLFERIEGGAAAPSDQSVALAMEKFDADTVHRLWTKAMERRETDPEGAITLGLGMLESDESEIEFGDERPAGWTAAQEAALQAARKLTTEVELPASERKAPLAEAYRRPILVDATLLKCALLAVALPQSLKTSTDEYEQFLGILRDDEKNDLQELLERGSWHHLVSVGFRTRLQVANWDRKLCETANDWWLSAGEVIATPHPLEQRRTLFFDLKGMFSGMDVTLRSAARDSLATCTTQGEALWTLLGGKDSTAFELFARLMELNQAGLFDDLLLRLRCRVAPLPDSEGVIQDAGVLRYEELSDGEQMVLGRMALFHLLSAQQDALLLLDEPETHFNDKWKREIVDIIDAAIGSTANDVLISTHSAIVLSDVFNDEIVMVQRAANGSGVQPVSENTFATDPSALMMNVFGADDSIGKRAQQFIEAKLSHATGTPEEMADLERLIERMGSGFYRSDSSSTP